MNTMPGYTELSRKIAGIYKRVKQASPIWVVDLKAGYTAPIIGI